MDWSALGGEERALLSRTFLFQGAPVEVVRAAVSDPRCRLEEAEREAVIYAPHTFYRCLAVLLCGAVEVSKEELLVSVLAPGDLFGAAALFNDREDYATTLTARSPCRILFFPQELVGELLARESLLSRNYIRYLSGRIRFLTEKLDGLLAGSAERKLSQYLLSHPDGVSCPATSLARQLGVSRASLYRAFDALTERGAIRRAGKRIEVLDEHLLYSV